MTTELHEKIIKFATIMRQVNFHIKNRLFPLLSIVATMSIAMGSVVQFHHHNSQGDIFLSVSLSADIGLGCHHGIVDCHHNHNHNHNNGNSRGDDCAMHLDDSPLTRDHQSHDSYSAAINSPCATIDGASHQPQTTIYAGVERRIPSTPLKVAPQLRAPPIRS